MPRGGDFVVLRRPTCRSTRAAGTSGSVRTGACCPTWAECSQAPSAASGGASAASPTRAPRVRRAPCSAASRRTPWHAPRAPRPRGRARRRPCRNSARCSHRRAAVLMPRRRARPRALWPPALKRPSPRLSQTAEWGQLPSRGTAHTFSDHGKGLRLPCGHANALQLVLFLLAQPMHKAMVNRPNSSASGYVS